MPLDVKSYSSKLKELVNLAFRPLRPISELAG
jgi:hypothetical protein